MVFRGGSTSSSQSRSSSTYSIGRARLSKKSDQSRSWIASTWSSLFEEKKPPLGRAMSSANPSSLWKTKKAPMTKFSEGVSSWTRWGWDQGTSCVIWGGTSLAALATGSAKLFRNIYDILTATSQGSTHSSGADFPTQRGRPQYSLDRPTSTPPGSQKSYQSTGAPLPSDYTSNPATTRAERYQDPEYQRYLAWQQSQLSPDLQSSTPTRQRSMNSEFESTQTGENSLYRGRRDVRRSRSRSRRKTQETEENADHTPLEKLQRRQENRSR